MRTTPPRVTDTSVPTSTAPNATPAPIEIPAGFVFRRDGVIYRQVDPSFAEEWQAYLGSGLYERLRDEGVVIPHTEVDHDLAAEPPAHSVIRPEPLELISYPYEWSFSQLQDAALLTLARSRCARGRVHPARRLCLQRPVPRRQARDDRLALVRAGRGLGGRGRLPPVLRAIPRAAGTDGQGRHPTGGLLRDHLDGIPLDLAARLLPGRTRLNSGWGRMSTSMRAPNASTPTTTRGEAEARGIMSPKKLATLIESLRNTVAGLSWEPEARRGPTTRTTRATGTPPPGPRCGGPAGARAVGGHTAWDLGANTGRYSRIAADAGYRVVALDIDPAAVERDYRPIRPMVGRHPAVARRPRRSEPRHGLGQRRARCLLDRIDADDVLALALVHHLAIGANVPLPMLASTCSHAGAAGHRRVRAQGRPDGHGSCLATGRLPRLRRRGVPAAFEPHFEVVANYTHRGQSAGSCSTCSAAEDAPASSALDPSDLGLPVAGPVGTFFHAGARYLSGASWRSQATT